MKARYKSPKSPSALLSRLVVVTVSVIASSPGIRARTALLLTLIASFAGVALTTLPAYSTGAGLRRYQPRSDETAEPRRPNTRERAFRRQPSRNSDKQSPDAQPAESHLNIARKGHTATPLLDGKILIAGGENPSGTVRDTEVYDPATRSFSISARLHTARADHSATALPDGRILIAGGHSVHGSLRSTELYDRGSSAFRRGPSLILARIGHTGTLLANGKVLIAGGDPEGTAEIFDPATLTFTLLASRMSAPRSFHSAIRLNSGEVLIAGGRTGDAGEIRSGEVFEPETLQFTATRNCALAARTRPLLRELPDGKVQIIGGDEKGSMEMFNAEGRYFTAWAQLMPDADSIAGIEQVLRSPGLAALINNRGALAPLARRSQLPAGFGDFVPAVRADVLAALDRSDHTMTEIPGARSTLVTGGLSSGGMTLMSAMAIESSPANVTADKTDYHPGDTVVISGTGWQPGETIALTLHRDNESLDTMLSSVADAGGNFQNADYVVQESDVDVTFLLTAVGESSGFAAQTTFTDTSDRITQIRFNTVDLVSSFTVGLPNSGGSNSRLRIQALNSGGTGEAVTGTGSSITVQVASGSGTGRFDTTSSGSFAAVSLTLQIPQGSQNSPDFFYRDTTAGSVTLTATVTATAGVINLPLGTTATIAKSVNKANTATTVASSANPADCAHSITFTATVAHGTAGGAGTPTGTVAFKDGANTLGTATLGAGPPFTATFTASSLPLGSHSITAVYGGDGNFNPSTSSILTQTVSDLTPPAITSCALDQSAFAGDNCQAAVPDFTSGVVAADSCSQASSLTVGQDPAAGTLLGIGTHNVTITVKDAANNSSTCIAAFIVADNTPPTITTCAPDQSAFADSNCQAAVPDFTAGIVATDICRSAASLRITQDPPAGALVGAGTHNVAVTVKDAAGNASTCNATFTVTDDTPPAITVIGANPVVIECHYGFIDPGANATDSCAGSVPVSTSGAVDANTPGVYTITYSASDGRGNSATASRTVCVKDTKKPVISLLGPDVMIVTVGDAFADPGATATDQCAGDLTGSIVATGAVDPLIVGIYTRTYNVSDPSGNSATPVTRTVKVQYSSTCGRTILQPINPDGTSVFKQKSTVPAKFRVCDSNGVSIGTPGVVAAFTLVQTISGTYVDGVSEPVDSTTPDSAFRWDPIEGEWIFNINTKGLAANRTYVFRISLNDGTYIDFRFGLK